MGRCVLFAYTKAIRAAGTTDPAQVRPTLKELSVRSLTGFDVPLDPDNSHLHKPAMIGRVEPSGNIAILWRSAGSIAPEPGEQTALRLAAE